MRNPAINWSEGMFLRPHHFQAAEKFWNELIGHNTDCVSPYAYGIKTVEVSAQALQNGSFEFGNLTARFKDGSIVAQDKTHIERIELGDRLNKEEMGEKPVVAYLGVPIAQEGQANVADTPGGVERFVGHERTIPDDSVGGNRQEVGFKSLNCRVIFSTETVNGYELIPLARLKKSPEEGIFEVDPDYFPPSLEIQAWPSLYAIVREIYDLIGSRIQSLADVIESKGISISSQVQGDLEKLLMIHALNESYAELSCIVFANGSHPLGIYTCLCRVIGRCSLFGNGGRVAEIPKYDHEDLATIFKWALARIRELIFAIPDDEFEQRYFMGTPRGLSVELKPEWFSQDWDWFLGVDGVTISRDECLRLLEGAIDWKLGSAEKVEQYMTHRKPGVRLRASPQIPRALPNKGSWVFLKIRQEKEAWQHVQASHTMAMRVRTEQIANLDSLNGQRRIMLSIEGKTYGLEFAIFAVKKRI